jgi:hypothetical protein
MHSTLYNLKMTIVNISILCLSTFCKNTISSLNPQETSVRGASRGEGMKIYSTLLVCQTISKNYLAFFRLVIPKTNAPTPPPSITLHKIVHIKYMVKIDQSKRSMLSEWLIKAP